MKAEPAAPATQPSPLAVPGAWNTVADGYNDEIVPLFSLYARDALRLAALPTGARVLDVAAGPGTLALLAAEDAEQVTAVDFAEAMVAVLRRRVAAEGVRNVEALVADGQALPFEDASFDGAFSMFGLIFYPDRAAGFREMRRVLRPGGRAVVSAWMPIERVPVLAAIFTTLRDLLPGLPLGGGRAGLTNEEEFRTEMSAAGFGDVSVHEVTHGATISSVAAFWASNKRSSAPLALVRKRLSPAEWEALERGMVAELERTFGTGPLEVEWPALLAVGVR